MFQSGELKSSTLVLGPNFKEWVPAKKFRALVPKNNNNPLEPDSEINQIINYYKPVEPNSEKNELKNDNNTNDVKIKESELTNINKPNTSEPDKSAFKKETSDNTVELLTNKEQQIKAEQKYPALSVLIYVYYASGVLLGVASAAFIVIIIGMMESNRDAKSGPLFIIPITGIISSITSFALAQGIKLFMDIESNLREIRDRIK
jgi:hypothetical protein